MNIGPACVACVIAVCLPLTQAQAQQASAQPPAEAPPAPKTETTTVDRAGILRDFAITLAAQQAYRLPRAEVRQYLDGPFWRDYVDSVTHLQKGFWDGDEPWTWNLVIHPLMGGLSYHQARTRGASHREAFLWTTAYSTHFELGVLGQAGLGNNRVSPFDLVFTPIAGAAWAAFEEWIERRFLRAGGQQRLLRSVLPVHAVGNLLRGRPPWRPHAELSRRRTP
jgi:hypothetical protein